MGYLETPSSGGGGSVDNLSGITDPAAARANLGLGAAAEHAVGDPVFAAAQIGAYGLATEMFPGNGVPGVANGWALSMTDSGLTLVPPAGGSAPLANISTSGLNSDTLPILSSKSLQTDQAWRIQYDVRMASGDSGYILLHLNGDTSAHYHYALEGTSGVTSFNYGTEGSAWTTGFSLTRSPVIYAFGDLILRYNPDLGYFISGTIGSTGGLQEGLQVTGTIAGWYGETYGTIGGDVIDLSLYSPNGHLIDGGNIKVTKL